jgi:hypothetical protein
MPHHFSAQLYTVQCPSKLASKLIERTFQHAGVCFERHTFKKSLNLKKKFEDNNFHWDKVAIASFDIQDLYPQCCFKAIQDAVQPYALRLSNLDHEKYKAA